MFEATDNPFTRWFKLIGCDFLFGRALGQDRCSGCSIVSGIGGWTDQKLLHGIHKCFVLLGNLPAIYGYFLWLCNYHKHDFNGRCGLYQNLDLGHLRLAESLARVASLFDEPKQVVP